MYDLLRHNHVAGFNAGQAVEQGQQGSLFRRPTAHYPSSFGRFFLSYAVAGQCRAHAQNGETHS
jgi:hypothetical protein